MSLENALTGFLCLIRWYYGNITQKVQTNVMDWKCKFNFDERGESGDRKNAKVAESCFLQNDFCQNHRLKKNCEKDRYLGMFLSQIRFSFKFIVEYETRVTLLRCFNLIFNTMVELVQIFWKAIFDHIPNCSWVVRL